jgi:hypothetical protein
LHGASQNGHVTVVKLLIGLGAKVASVDDLGTVRRERELVCALIC